MYSYDLAQLRRYDFSDVVISFSFLSLARLTIRLSTQCLSVFFPSYAFASFEHQQCIEEAFMPVMDAILDGMWPTDTHLMEGLWLVMHVRYICERERGV